MLENQKFQSAQVIGQGEPLTLDNLSPPRPSRWVVRLKAQVVAAVSGGLLTADEACRRYSLNLEEFTSWWRALDQSGIPGLRVTRPQEYRHLYDRGRPTQTQRFWSDRDYYRQRWHAERALAKAASQSNVAAIHEELAQRYQALVHPARATACSAEGNHPGGGEAQ